MSAGRWSGASPSAGGYTLVETVIASTLGMVVVSLVFSTFVAQSALHGHISKEVVALDLVQTASRYAADEVRLVARGGLVFAGSDSVVYNHPLAIATVCAVSGSTSHLHFPLDGGAVEGTKVAGAALRADDGSWAYFPVAWSDMGISFSTASAAACAANGADTTGIAGEFASLGVGLTPGDLLMLYQIRQVFAATSNLDPATTGLFIVATGEGIGELISGLHPETGFEYRRSGGGWSASPSSGDLAWIETIRFTAAASLPGGAIERWTVQARLPNRAF